MERMTEKSINLAMLVENGDSHMNADEDCGDNRLPLHSSLAPSSLLIMLQTNASVFGKLRDEYKNLQGLFDPRLGQQRRGAVHLSQESWREGLRRSAYLGSESTQ